MNFTRPLPLLGVLSGLLVSALGSGCMATQAPLQQPVPATVAAPRLALQADRVAVTVYEVRSSVPEIGARGATDQFKTALVGNGRFRVMERARFNEGVVREKQLNASGQSSGRSAQQPVAAADFIFEASITEATAGERQAQAGINIAGLQLGGGGSRDSIGIDVRIVDAVSGEIRDAIALRRPLRNSGAQVAGTQGFVQTVLAQRGKSASAYVPDVSLQTSRKDSVDEALRALIVDAVAQLAARF